MKSNILLVGMSAIMATSAGANALEYRPFVGVTMGIQGAYYDNAVKSHDIDLPKDFIAFGIEGGTRFGSYNDIYNGGLTLNIDTTGTEKITEKLTDVQQGKIKTTTLTTTYDNYIRLSGDKIKRIDLVLGAGVGAMNYHFDDNNPLAKDETVWSTSLAFKAGLDFELTKNVTLSATMRVFVPTRGHYAIETSYLAGGAIKYVF